jgi:hypothetical protein
MYHRRHPRYSLRCHRRLSSGCIPSTYGANEVGRLSSCSTKFHNINNEFTNLLIKSVRRSSRIRPLVPLHRKCIPSYIKLIRSSGYSTLALPLPRQRMPGWIPTPSPVPNVHTTRIPSLKCPHNTIHTSQTVTFQIH